MSPAKAEEGRNTVQILQIQARLKRLHHRLSMEQAELENRLRSTSETGSSQELSAYDNHPADLGTTTANRELDMRLVRHLRRRQEDVQRALAKIHQGSYGRCDRCGAIIEPARLEAEPETAFCLSCAEIVKLPYHPRDTERPPATPMEPLGVDQDVARWEQASPDVSPAATDAETF